MNSKLKKSTVVITVILIFVITALVAVYAIMAGMARTEKQEAMATPTQLVLNKNLDMDYPATPREVIKYYTEMEKCFYNEECTEEEIEQLGMKARELYDLDLLAANETTVYMERLKEEIKEFKDKGMRLASANVAASTSVDFFEDDGFEFARIYCGYTILNGGGKGSNITAGEVYLLRRDSDRHWKIYGWDSADKVNPGIEKMPQ